MSKLSKFVIIMVMGIMIAMPVYAQPVEHIMPCGWDTDGDGTVNECKLCHLWQLASNLMNFITWNLALPIAPLLIVVAGVLYLTSGGDQGKLKKAQDIFINTLVGIVIIFCAWLIVDTALKTISGGNFESIIPAWNEFPPC